MELLAFGVCKTWNQSGPGVTNFLQPLVFCLHKSLVANEILETILNQTHNLTHWSLWLTHSGIKAVTDPEFLTGCNLTGRAAHSQRGYISKSLAGGNQRRPPRSATARYQEF